MRLSRSLNRHEVEACASNVDYCGQAQGQDAYRNVTGLHRFVRSQVPAKEQSCDSLHIDERMDPLESTVPDDVALSGGGRSVTGS